MSRQLEETFNLDSINELKYECGQISEEIQISSNSALDSINSKMTSLESRVSQIGFQAHDDEMDVFSTDAHQSYRDAMDLALNVDPRSAAKILDSAANMLRLALDAKNAKIDKKLRLAELQLKQRRIELEEERFRVRTSDTTETPDGIIIADRDDLLAQLRSELDDK